MSNANQFPERLIKKYPNRRLYDTQTSSYITLADVKVLVIKSIPFSITDARTGDDLTRSILLQIVMEEEAAGKPLFSIAMLSLMIRYYGHAMQDMMANCLENSAQAMVTLQEQMEQTAAGEDGEKTASQPSLQRQTASISN